MLPPAVAILPGGQLSAHDGSVGKADADPYAVDEFEMLTLSYYQQLHAERREIVQAVLERANLSAMTDLVLHKKASIERCIPRSRSLVEPCDFCSRRGNFSRFGVQAGQECSFELYFPLSRSEEKAISSKQ